MASSESNKVFTRNFRKQKAHMKVESGTCNVCSAPCSSCLHANRAFMASKTEDSSNEMSRENNTSYSASNVNPTGNRGTASEASNLITSVNSSHASVSENAESKTNLKTIGGTSGGNTSEEQCDSVKGNLTTVKCENLRLEGHDDNILCVSGAATNKTITKISGSADSLVSEANDKTVIPSQAAPDCLDSKSDVETIHPISLSTDVATHNLCSMENEIHSSKFTGDDVGPKNLQVKEEPLECSEQTNEVTSGSLKDGGDYEEASAKNCPTKLEENVDNNDSNLPAEVLGSTKLNQECDKVRASVVLHDDPKETCPQSHTVDESDESDIVEQDVKVCDICGDSGREDLLAVCSRCSDGAEHTYCMRKRMDEVPKGDWLCEECVLEDEEKHKKQEEVSVTVDRVEKTHSSTQKASDIYGSKTTKDRTTGPKVSRKRPAEEIEGSSSSAKKQALESITKDSPKALSPSRIGGALSRDSSFKNLDRGKVKPAHQFHSSTRSIDDNPGAPSSPTTAPRSLTPRGASFSKSSSFNFKNKIPKVKLVDDVSVKLKSTKESVSSVDTKEGASRVISKSTSFKSPGYTGRLHTGESKVKMLSPTSSLVQDLKGVKHTKERSTFERKNSFKSDRPSVNPSSVASSTASTAVKVDQKPSRAETASVSSTKSTNYFSRRGSEMPSPSGEVKRQLLNSSEQKPIYQASPKYDSLASSVASDKLNVNNLNQQPELLSRHNAERIKESSTSRPKQQSIGRSVLPSEKCKDTDSSSHISTVDSPRYDVKSSREESINKGNKLKAAIEAAMLKKPGIYNRKNKVTDQSEDKSEVPPSQDHQATPIYTRNPLPAPEDVSEGQAINGGSYKQATGNLLSYNASETISVLLKMSAIPEQEYVWQGSFEIDCIRKTPEICDGFQAHLSTSASPKVVEAVNKFPHKLMLSEVPRSSTWPIQFEENGVKEDNIALYFFARDLESFDKSYKVLVESMMRRDLALKANIDGVELLIFPSNQLPEKSQRWNMLYYLWGVFRGKRLNYVQQVPSASVKKLCIPLNTPTAIMSFPDNICSATPIDKDLPLPTVDKDLPLPSVCGIATSKVHPLIDLPPSLPSLNKDCDTQMVDSANVKDTEWQDCQVDSLPPLQKSTVQPCPQEVVLSTDCKVDNEEPHRPLQVKKSFNDYNGSEKIPIDLDAPLEEESESSAPNLNKIPTGSLDVAPSEKNNIKELDSWHVNHRKRSYTDASPSETPSKSSYSGSRTTTLFNEANDGGNVLKKQKPDSNVLYGGNEYSNSSLSMREKQCGEETGLPNLNDEIYLFPVGPHQENEVGIPWIGLSSVEDKAPNLELALGAKTKPFMKQGLPPFLVGRADTSSSNQRQVPPPDKVAAAGSAINGEEDEVSASLSLSLAFPSADKDRGEQLLAERRHVKPPLALFGSFSDK